MPPRLRHCPWGANVAKRDVYVSVDIEADGPIPGPYSMLSFGFAVCGTYDGTEFTAPDPAARTFYAELRPISDRFDPAALEVSGLDRDRLAREGRDPGEAMNAAFAWVRETAAGGTAVAVAYPLGFDWMWLYWYFMRFADAGSPFGHSRHLDVKPCTPPRPKPLSPGPQKGRCPPHCVPGARTPIMRWTTPSNRPSCSRT